MLLKVHSRISLATDSRKSVQHSLHSRISVQRNCCVPGIVYNATRQPGDAQGDGSPLRGGAAPDQCDSVVCWRAASIQRGGTYPPQFSPEGKRERGSQIPCCRRLSSPSRNLQKLLTSTMNAKHCELLLIRGLFPSIAAQSNQQSRNGTSCHFWLSPPVQVHC